MLIHFHKTLGSGPIGHWQFGGTWKATQWPFKVGENVNNSHSLSFFSFLGENIYVLVQ